MKKKSKARNPFLEKNLIIFLIICYITAWNFIKPPSTSSTVRINCTSSAILIGLNCIASPGETARDSLDVL